MSDVHADSLDATRNAQPPEPPGPRFTHSIPDPVFGAAEESLRRIEIIAWQAFDAIATDGAAPAPSRVLLINGDPAANDTTAQLLRQAAGVYADAGIEVDRLDLSQPTTLAEIAERLAAAHAVHVVTHQASREIAAVMDKLDPVGVAGRAYGLMVHGIATGIESMRRALSDQFDRLGLIDAGAQSRLDRFIGYHQPYAMSPEAMLGDQPLLGESRNIATAVANAVVEIREGRLHEPDLLLAHSGAD